jgi:hypothetical protein
MEKRMRFCKNEAYLSPWFNENKDRGVEIIGLAVERKNDFNSLIDSLLVEK